MSSSHNSKSSANQEKSAMKKPGQLELIEPPPPEEKPGKKIAFFKTMFTKLGVRGPESKFPDNFVKLHQDCMKYYIKLEFLHSMIMRTGQENPDFINAHETSVVQAPPKEDPYEIVMSAIPELISWKGEDEKGKETFELAHSIYPYMQQPMQKMAYYHRTMQAKFTDATADIRNYIYETWPKFLKEYEHFEKEHKKLDASRAVRDLKPSEKHDREYSLMKQSFMAKMQEMMNKMEALKMERDKHASEVMDLLRILQTFHCACEKFCFNFVLAHKSAYGYKAKDAQTVEKK
ncbi:unnamed protein product [Bursaphelenchus okinawaensis]|uniref:BAR domain-containing protein n=1 Tax=Bursaphelenchus okinawaensis TaxID=465554 RepID=A0A811LUL5_9BILA|nr:unnamed protein product [Bursaphelenchus okinawaensis]CAG9127904.1 unnamed protein product [Bursaphelenchus okinawaensis]